jgi:protein-disulfide isomerase
MAKRTANCLIALALAAGCQDPDTASRLGRLEDRVAELERHHQSAEAPGTPGPSSRHALPVQGDPFEGPEAAPVTMVEGFDFTCPHCYRVRVKLTALREQFGSSLRIVYKHFVVYPNASTAAHLAACAAHRQGKYLEIQDLIFKTLWVDKDPVDERTVSRIAQAAGVPDIPQFERDFRSPGCRQELAEDRDLMTRAGARITPSFFVNGRYIGGDEDLEIFEGLITEELKTARATMAAQSMSGSDYYQSLAESGE